MRVMLAEKWVKMSSQAQKLALSLDYDLDGTALCLLLEALGRLASALPTSALNIEGLLAQARRTAACLGPTCGELALAQKRM